MAFALKFSLHTLMLYCIVLGQGAVIVVQQQQLRYASHLTVQPHIRSVVIERKEGPEPVGPGPIGHTTTGDSDSPPILPALQADPLPPPGP